MSIDSDWDTKGSSQSKVSNLYNSLFINEQILWLEVPVQHTTLMAEQDALEQL